MRAAFIRATGASSCIEYGELPTPTIGPEQVLVKVAAVAINPIDVFIRCGAIAMPQSYPYIIGCDLAGTVAAVGSQARRYKVGDRVWGSNQSLFGRQGSFAEFAAVDEQWLYPSPAAATDAQMAAGALTGITAQLGLFKFGELKSGEVVFVNGGSGGVGSAVVQMAKSAGAHVITTVGSDEKAAYCKSLGADCVINYRAADLDDQIRKFAAPHGGIHIWFETQREPTLERTISMMAFRGRIIAMAGRQARPELPWGAFYTRDLSIRGFAMFNALPEEQQASGAFINGLFEAGGWKPLIGREFGLSEAAAAHQLQEDNTVGKHGTLSGKIVLYPGR